MTEAQAEQAGPGRAPGPAGRAGALVQYALLAGLLLSMLDSSIVNVAVAPVARDLHAGFAVLAVATLGLLLITVATPLGLIALILAGRSVAIGLVITPLLQALVQPLRPDQLGDASTLFNTWQRIAGSFGISLIAALYATRARAVGPAAALHSAGLALVLIAAAGALGALALPPRVRNTAMARG